MDTDAAAQELRLFQGGRQQHVTHQNHCWFLLSKHKGIDWKGRAAVTQEISCTHASFRQTKRRTSDQATARSCIFQVAAATQVKRESNQLQWTTDIHHRHTRFSRRQPLSSSPRFRLAFGSMISPRLSNPERKVSQPGSSRDSPASSHFTAEPWIDDACILDIDHFVKSLTAVKAKGIRPDLVGSIVSHYATKWLPELSGVDPNVAKARHEHASSSSPESSSAGSSMAAWMKKKFFLETLVGILPPEKDCLPCAFLLRLLRMASMVEAEPAYLADLEARVAWQLDQASLKELMIPAFSHTCRTLLDVDLVLRLVRRFVTLDDAIKSGAAIVKVAKLVDNYLAEAALDANMTLLEFEALAGALPAHARATDDGLYRAMDTYLKAHPSTTKHERKALFKLIDTRKLSSDAALHAARNERLPVRAVFQVLFSEQSKLNRLTNEWSGSFNGSRSPNAAASHSSLTTLELPARCPSKREVIVQQQEIRKLRDDVARLQIQCHSLQSQLDKLVEKRKNKGYFRWKSLLFRNGDGMDKSEDDESRVMRRTPQPTVDGKKSRIAHEKTTPPKWRNSTS